LLSKTSDFDINLQDQETGGDLFVNFITGDYRLCTKRLLVKAFHAKEQSSLLLCVKQN
jgi:hypothetical protein